MLARLNRGGDARGAVLAAAECCVNFGTKGCEAGSRPVRAGVRYAASTSNPVTLRSSALNSTATRYIGSPRARYLSA